MPGDVEREGLLQTDDGAEVTLVAGFGELVQRGVGAGDVGGMVLVVVKFEDLAADRRFKGCVVVGQVGQGVGRHGRGVLSSG